MRGHVRVGQDDVVVEGAADRDRPVLDAPGLAHQAVAIDRLEQRRGGGRLGGERLGPGRRGDDLRYLTHR